MKLNVFIVSVACFACLVPQAYGSLLVAKALAAAGAVKGAALLGAGALAAKGAAKGAVAALAAKGAAAVAAKHAALKSVGAAVVAAKALAVKGAVAKGAAVLAAKKAAVGGALALGAKVLGAGAALVGGLSKHPVVHYEPVQIDVRRVPFYRVPEVPCAYPTVLADRISTLATAATSALARKGSAASNLLAALSGASAYSPPVLLDRYAVVEPSFYTVQAV